MSATTAPRPGVDLGRFVATIVLLAAVMLFLVRIVRGADDLGSQPPSAWLEELAFGIIVLVPLALAAVSHRWDPALRGGVMTGVGLLLVALGVLTLISIGFVFLLLGGALTFAGIRVGAGARFRRFLISAVVVVAAGVLAPIGSLLLLDPAPACWEQRAGEPWRRIPVRGSGGEQAWGGFGSEGTCSSDTVTRAELGLAIAPWAAATTGLILVGRRRAA